MLADRDAGRERRNGRVGEVRGVVDIDQSIPTIAAPASARAWPPRPSGTDCHGHTRRSPEAIVAGVDQDGSTPELVRQQRRRVDRRGSRARHIDPHGRHVHQPLEWQARESVPSACRWNGLSTYVPVFPQRVSMSIAKVTPGA